MPQILGAEAPVPASSSLNEQLSHVDEIDSFGKVGLFSAFEFVYGYVDFVFCKRFCLCLILLLFQSCSSQFDLL